MHARQRLGKYRIERRLASGGFADVYRAKDTVEGISVALKIPRAEVLGNLGLQEFRREVRLTASLDHPNILPIKTAEFIDGHLVIATPLGIESLAERLSRRMGRPVVLSFADQLLEALAFAHKRHIIHRDLKPENMILFPENRLRLADFGIAQVALKTLDATTSGTIGYFAPEQALGRPSCRSDVFSAGLLIYRLMSGVLPEWPFEWPPAGIARVKEKYHPDLIEVVRKSMEVDQRWRFEDAGRMLAAWKRVRPKGLGGLGTRRKSQARRATGRTDWRDLRRRAFVREHGRELETRHACGRCGGPVSEAMTHCPWCGTERKVHREDTRFPAQCPRCRRGVKLDWRFCPWCYGAAIGPLSERAYTDSRYEHRCHNKGCDRRELLPFMRYCPWCRSKVTFKWKIAGSTERCPRCSWGVNSTYWRFCPWCGRKVGRR